MGLFVCSLVRLLHLCLVLEIILSVYLHDNPAHILVFEVDKMEHFPLPIDPRASDCPRQLVNLLIRICTFPQIMLQGNPILILIHRIENDLLPSGLPHVPLPQDKPGQPLDHQNFLTNIQIPLKLLHIHINKVNLPQLFLNLFIIVIILNKCLLLLLDISF